MRVLTYVPLKPTRPRLHPLTAAAIESLDWPAMPIAYGRNDSATNHYTDLCDKHDQARDMALYGGYDALFLVEADMVIPPDALRKLATLDVPVAYGLYVRRYPPYEWLALTKLTSDDHEFVSADANYARQWLGDGTQAIETCGVGLGCTLIRRDVLEKLSFRQWRGMADDWAFALDCCAYGIPQFTHTGVVCGHVSDDVVLWPAVDEPGLVRKEAL